MSTSKVTDSTHFSQQDNAIVAKDRRKAAKVDLSSMQKHRNLTPKQMADEEAKLTKDIAALAAELEKMQPNMHAAERYEGVVEKLRDCEKDLEAAKDAANEVTKRFDDVRRERQQLFQECYKHVSDTLGVIYKDLTRSSKHPLGGNAYLTLDNTDEPYAGGIRFTAMPPMKRFRDMDQLSGGEKTMAALALLFSIHSYRQAPFFVIDEVDAALDNVNVKKICNYIRQRSREFQCVVISLKDMFFEHADILVGICKDVDTLSSRVLTLNLRTFDGPAALPPPPQGSSSSSSSSSRVAARPVLRSPMATSASHGTPSSRGSVGSSAPSSGQQRGHDESKTQRGGGIIGGKRKTSPAAATGAEGGSRRARRTHSNVPAAIAEEDDEAEAAEVEDDDGGDQEEDEDEEEE